MSGRALLEVNLAAAWFLTGLSWFVQMVQYPLLARSKEKWAEQRRRNTLLMAIPMAVEFGTAAWLAFGMPEFHHRAMVYLFLLLVAIWLITFLRHVPLHRRMIAGEDVFRELSRWNWVRTICWTARAMALVLIASA